MRAAKPMSAPAARRRVTARPILYSFRRCPYAMRARLALLVSGTTCEIREVKLSHKPAAMLAVSPKATVPVVVRPDGRVIEESLDIMHWALARSDPEGWLTRDDRGLIAMFDGAFKHHLDRYKYPDRHGSDPREHRAAGLGLLQGLAARLGGQANLGGDARGLTDAAIFPFVRQFAATDPAWFDAESPPSVRAWLDRHLAGSLFVAAMVRLKPWQPDDEAIGFALA